MKDMEKQSPENEKVETQTEEKPETEKASQEEPKKEEVDYKNRYFYLAAEMDNLKKRMEREKTNLIKFGNESILSDLVEVVDNFDRTIEMLRSDQDEKMKNIVTGLDMVKKQFVDVLGKSGLTAIESIGKTFDPNFHEAIAQEYVEGKKPNEVIKEYQKGYVLNGRLLRASKVILSNDKQ
jgi:molecular chaperone GrpE